MSDGLDLGQHGGAAAGSAAAVATLLTTWASKFFRARDEKAREDAATARAEAQAVKLGQLETKLDQAVRMLERQEALLTRVAVLESKQSDIEEIKRRLALVEATASKAHARLDRKEED